MSRDIVVSEQKVDVANLAKGMYVCRLDRDWLGTPFPIQGFYVDDSDDVAALRKLCDFVVIDRNRSQLPPGSSESLSLPPEQRMRVAEYRNTATLAEEMPRARMAHEQASSLAGKILAEVREGRKISEEDVREAVEPVVKSVLRNADAFLWLSALRKRHVYEYSHAINCSLLAATFGRHMGFSQSALLDLASGGLLLDVGKSEISEALLLTEGALTDSERQQIRKHVARGVAVLEQSGIHSRDVVDMVRTHHERYDGSGYPDGLMRNQIPLFGRMAAVIDSYDALTSHRPYRKAHAAHHALQQIYRDRDRRYHGEIVEQFMQCLSVYPTGSLVELNTGAVAVVMAQNHARRLRPRVMVLTTADKKLRSEFEEVDLLELEQQQKGSRPIEIVGTLEAGAYGIDPTELYLT
jgi:HD-GYP domain-containing protein (c-di-GMP phosphodiesterase class II)